MRALWQKTGAHVKSISSSMADFPRRTHSQILVMDISCRRAQKFSE